MAALVQTQGADGSGSDTLVVDITSTAGNTLVLVTAAYLGENTALALSSVTDSAGGAWTYSTAASNQNPPAAGSWDAGDGAYGLAAAAVKAGAAAVTSVTVKFSHSIDFFAFAAVLEFSGIPTDAQVIAAASSSTLHTGVTSATTPAATSPAAGVGIAVVTPSTGDWTTATSGWTLISFDGSVLGAYDLSAAAGSVSCTLSGGSSQGVMGELTMVIGEPPAQPSALMSAGII